MRTILAGSRSISDYELLRREIILSQFVITEVVSGGASGVDSLGERWARENGIPLRMFRADWGQFGYRAGIRRNCEMARYADQLIAIWDGRSKGTAHMVGEMTLLGKAVHVGPQR